VPLSKLRDTLPQTVREELEAIASDLLAAGALVQAFCDRRASAMSETTDYLLATNWHLWRSAGSVRDSLAWARRYLYAVAETTWLGPDLARRARPTLADIDDLTAELAEGLRVEAASHADRRRIERALADIVPGLAPADPTIPTL
jgi:hypothetical protein